MKVYEAVTDAVAVAAEGVDTVFGLMGDGNMWLWATLEQFGRARFFSARYENNAVAMADGWARLADTVGVVNVKHGPGFAQTGSALTTAVRNHTPLVVLVGDCAQGGNRLQSFDQRAFAAAWGARFVHLTATTRRAT